MAERYKDGVDDDLYGNPIAHLAGPDVVLPEQIIAGARTDSYMTGEKALMLSVLEDGIRCFQNYLRDKRLRKSQLPEQAEAWIRAVDYEWPFSFNNCCETLGIDADALRNALLCWKHNKLLELSNEKRREGEPATSHLHAVDGSGPRRISRPRLHMHHYGHIRITPKR